MCRKQIVEAFVPEGARDWAVARSSARESGWDEILQRAQTLPMLAPRQVIIVEDAESVEKLGDKARDQVVEALEAYFASPAPFTVLVLEAASLDGRQKIRENADRESSGRRVDNRRRIRRCAGHANGERPWRGDRSRRRGVARGDSEWRAGAHVRGAGETRGLRAVALDGCA